MIDITLEIQGGRTVSDEKGLVVACLSYISKKQKLQAN
jgi:hypothetical protein